MKKKSRRGPMPQDLCPIFSIQLTKEQKKWLRQQATRMGWSQSHTLRHIVATFQRNWGPIT